ncbi:MAG TPA: ABC transporter permease [bacterium]|nr:ABC transporter permease [bacterium]
MADKKNERVTIIRPTPGWVGIDFIELWEYRDIALMLAVRDIKVRYKQTFFGAAWAVIQPFCAMVVFTLLIGRMFKVPTEGIPYPIFSYSGLLLWQYFSQSITQAGNSLNASSNLITKIYFPRILIPMSATFAGLLDYLIASLVLIGMMVFYKYSIALTIFFVPVVLFFTWLLATGMGLWFSALNVEYRDIRHALPFLVQMWMFLSPVIYPSSILEKYRWISFVNPMDGFITAHRMSFLHAQPINYGFFLVSASVTVIIFFSGLYYFKRVEKNFADRI